MTDSKNSEQPVALVTGSARGIGFEIARVLGEDGYAVMLSDINEEGLAGAAKELEAANIACAYIKADVSVAEDADKLVAGTIEKFGRIDVLVNNAGITRDGLLMRMDENAWDLVLKVNLKGTFLMSKAVVRPMLKQKAGSVINIASVIGLMGNAGQANYAASKAGIIGFTKSFAKEFGRKGIRANAIAPGFIQSEMTAVLPEKVTEQMLAQIPMNTFGSPRDVANAVSFLASNKASYITGQVLTVDGGMVMA
ncbi:MAG: 3-oxoacyl-[acyl-carrier protein] reductase [Clostridiales bacterium]|jgi:3-oxoacyl-[acyl-carrier protein] reductase|nr:3-oxoacyl-[acyl-carrier protein] reductase [Clostridiales bacterium]MDN5281515.1 3-oxoacyl-[acyl-carrier protein] reductase [Candidatus Ozemobacter sp.]